MKHLRYLNNGKITTKFNLPCLFGLCFGLWLFIFGTCYAEDKKASSENSTSVLISEHELQKLATAINAIKNYYVNDVAEDALFASAISGMLNGLDPHSEYLQHDDLDVLETITTGKFGGIGIEVVPEQGLIKVVSPVDDSPASKAGIKAGDFIVKIDDKLVEDLQLHQAIKLMRGEKNSFLTLTILRKNSLKPLVFKIKREIVNIQSVKSKMLSKHIGYLRIAFFQEDTNEELLKSIKVLKKNNLQGLVIDLRNNPGGLFDSATQIADDFLDSNKLKNDNIVFTKGKNNIDNAVKKATAGELLPNIPIVVLINEGSASSSEILAGALQDHKRAVILGTRSFGKGSVQTLIPIDEDSAIKLTTALYYTPLGHPVQETGITPDIIIDNNAKLVEDHDENTQINVDESSLSPRLQNINADSVNKNSIELEINSEKNAKANLPFNTKINEDTSQKADNQVDYIANQDYQLYEALHILQAMTNLTDNSHV